MPTRKQFDAIIPFLDRFEAAGSSTGALNAPAGFDYSKLVTDFIQALQGNGWIDSSFDWADWQEAAQQYVETPDKIELADAETLQKLFTTHVRKERFCEGHLAEMFANGHVSRLLRRLNKIKPETVTEVLQKDQEEYPHWLGDADGNMPPPLDKFFTSRVVYYPGAGTDGRAFGVFTSAGSAHCVVNIDRKVTAENVLAMLQPNEPHHLNGYTPLVQQIVEPDELTRLLKLNMLHPFPEVEPGLRSALWVVLARAEDRSEEHGPKRIALLHMQAEAVWTCWNLWKRSDRNPFAVILQDHTWGGNWTNFGGNSPLFSIASRTQLPKYLLVADNTDSWPNYEAVSDWSQRRGGRNKLYSRSHTC